MERAPFNGEAAVSPICNDYLPLRRPQAPTKTNCCDPLRQLDSRGDGTSRRLNGSSHKGVAGPDQSRTLFSRTLFGCPTRLRVWREQSRSRRLPRSFWRLLSLSSVALINSIVGQTRFISVKVTYKSSRRRIRAAGDTRDLNSAPVPRWADQQKSPRATGDTSHVCGNMHDFAYLYASVFQMLRCRHERQG